MIITGTETKNKTRMKQLLEWDCAAHLEEKWAEISRVLAANVIRDLKTLDSMFPTMQL